MKPIGTLLLENGAWIIENTQSKVLAYRRQSGTPILRVPYVNKNGECVLARHIKFREGAAPFSDALPQRETNDLLTEIIGHLAKAGISARITD